MTAGRAWITDAQASVASAIAIVQGGGVIERVQNAGKRRDIEIPVDGVRGSAIGQRDQVAVAVANPTDG